MPRLSNVQCRLILFVVLAIGFVLHYRFLAYNCPLDLAGDEAQYWDWSRNLDYNYYSKPPMVAWLIRGGCEIFGNTVLGVRFPALVLAVGTSILTYIAGKRATGSERVGLGAVLLSHLVPMFIAGSVIMTIDPPVFFFWALSGVFAIEALLHDKKWAWIGMGFALGLGFLSKYMAFLFLLGVLAQFILNPASRKWLKSPFFYAMIGIAGLFALPPLVWNVRHEWVSAKHVAGDTSTGFNWKNPFEFVGGQLGAVGPALAIVMIAGVVYAYQRRKLPENRGMLLLACLTVPYFALVGAWSFKTTIQVNWPAPAYFAGIILCAAFLAEKMKDPTAWKFWRWCLWGTVAMGLPLIPMSHNMPAVYPVMNKLGVKPKSLGPLYKLYGPAELGKRISEEIKKQGLKPDPMIVGEKYDFASLLAFYVEGQPRTFCVGSWFADEKRRTRWSQFDIWEDCRLDNPKLLGKDCIFWGYSPTPQKGDEASGSAEDFAGAFESFTELEPVVVQRKGVTLRTYHIFVGKNYQKLLTRPEALKH